MQTESIISRLEAVVAEYGTKTALTFLRNGRIETELTYHQLHFDVIQFAATLRHSGVSP